MAERGRPQRPSPLDRHGDAEGAEHGLERQTDRFDRRAHECDLVRRHTRADRGEHLLGRELERPAEAGAFEEPDRAVERGDVRPVGEHHSLQMGETGREELLRTWRELDDVAAGEPREILDEGPKRGVDRAARLVRDREVHLRAGGERLEDAPLDARQVFEPVDEDRSACPRAEIAGQPVERTAAKRGTVPRVPPIELVVQ